MTKAICSYLAHLGAVTVKNGAAAFRVKDAKGVQRYARIGTPSAADIFVFWKSWPVCIEVKAAGDSLSDGQREWLMSAQKAGAVIIVARDVGDVIRVMNRLLNEPGRTVPDDLKVNLEKRK